MIKRLDIQRLLVGFYSKAKLSLLYIFALGIVSQLVGCSTNSSHVLASISTNSVTAEIIAGGEFLRALQEQGRLVWVSKDDHGQMTTGEQPWSQFKEVKYPFSVTFYITKNGDSCTNHYTVMRESKDAVWQLRKAWKTDSKGYTVKEWP